MIVNKIMIITNLADVKFRLKLEIFNSMFYGMIKDGGIKRVELLLNYLDKEK